MYKTDEIKAKVIEQFEKELGNGETTLPDVSRRDLYGHEAGMPFEFWVRSFLIKNKWKVFYPNEFLTKCFDVIGKDKKIILEFLADVWWGILLYTPRQLKDYLAGKTVNRWQQEGADLILFYGEDISKDFEKIILINVKSHEVNRMSRAPNIMSGQRLLQFFDHLTRKADYKDALAKLDLWFVGIYWEANETGAVIKNAHIKDLFKLDTSKIPQINFDAAIQIQWHVKDMIERDQTRSEFIRNLAEIFLKQWERHKSKKQEKYTRLVTRIKENLLS